MYKKMRTIWENSRNYKYCLDCGKLNWIENLSCIHCGKEDFTRLVEEDGEELSVIWANEPDYEMEV